MAKNLPLKTINIRTIHRPRILWRVLWVSLGAMVLFANAYAVDLRSWDNQISGNSRFVVLNSFENEAVLDKETQLVWGLEPFIAVMTWNDAKEHCYQRIVGGRMGWRLPAIEELTSLVDRSETPAPPSEHPFIIIPNLYWSATTRPANTSVAYELAVFGGSVAFTSKNNLVREWCVRGGSGYDAY